LAALNLIRGTQFRRDVKLSQRRSKDMAKLCELILVLSQGNPLPPRHTDHRLAGAWKHHRECHLEPDWLLVYKIDGDDLYLVRTAHIRICSDR
jgi:mRNA interferase YafQ